MFDVCQSQLSRFGCNQCGLYAPPHYFDRTKSCFACKVDWVQAAKVQRSLIQHFDLCGYGDVPEKWYDRGIKDPGCGVKSCVWFRPPVKVIDIMLDDGTWRCFIAELPPRLLMEEIELVQETFDKATQKLTDADFADVVPITFPRLDVIDPIKAPDVFRFDWEKWYAEGKPTLDQQGWILLTMIIAGQDLVNLSRLFDLAEWLESDWSTQRRKKRKKSCGQMTEIRGSRKRNRARCGPAMQPLEA